MDVWEVMKSPFADIKTQGKQDTEERHRQQQLERFIEKDTEWVHRTSQVLK